MKNIGNQDFKMSGVVILLLINLSFFFSFQQKPWMKDYKLMPSKQDTFVGNDQLVVFSMDTTSRWHYRIPDWRPYEPGKRDLDTLRILISRALNHMNNERIMADRNLYVSDHKFQVVFGVNTVNEVNCWIFAFCNNSDVVTSQRWKDKVYTVQGGGNCYFNLKINIFRKVYFEARVNGV